MNINMPEMISLCFRGMCMLLSSCVSKPLACLIGILIRKLNAWCRFMDVWAGFISMEVAEQNIAAARGVYKRCYSHVLEDGSQVCLQCTCSPQSILQIWGKPPVEA